jgi:hypothetical protein
MKIISPPDSLLAWNAGASAGGGTHQALASRVL